MAKFVYCIHRYTLPRQAVEWQEGADTVEETIRLALQENLMLGDRLRIGKKAPLPLLTVETDEVIASLQDQLADLEETEADWDWLADLTEEEKHALQERLTAAFYQWAKATDHLPEGFQAQDIHEYGIDEDGHIFEKVSISS